jgi:hypothetical protein
MRTFFLTFNVPLILKVREIIFFSRAKHRIPCTFRIRGTLVLLCPLRRGEETGRGGGEGGGRERREREGESKSKGERETKREKEKERKKGGRLYIFLDRPGHNEKSANYVRILQNSKSPSKQIP